MAKMPALPNSSTPMAFLPEQLAVQVTISTYILVGTLGALVWNLLSNIHSDFHLLVRYPIKLPTIVYFFSRLAALGYAVLSTTFETAPISSPCFDFNKGVDWMFVLAMSSTSFLFLIRVLAIFHRHKYIRAFFILMWLGVVAAVLTATQGVIGGSIGPTQHCMVSEARPYVGAAVVVPFVNDTFVFLAISWKLMSNTGVEDLTLKSELRVFFRGDYLPALSRGLLKDGQVYYLTTVSTNLVTVVVFFIPFIPPVYRTMFTVPNAMLTNAMACRVYKRTKFGFYRESADSGRLGDFPVSSKNDAISIPLTFAPPTIHQQA
ncbi:hypothetical protein NLJ89_g2970 [Agrocybe chaxingu]|uniref:Uncharacterized protein n=1 Tax=Agrocybe chaxingu TaxID=84603 RepID=A0A9W8MXA0_9AGAR|nr:hypothetical protein NLJ89_g2970 [Agrocybe chaxingu]